MSDTIGAVASPAGRSARGIIRFDGPATGEILAELCGIRSEQRALHTPLLRLRDMPEQARGIRCIVLRYARGASYTGGDSAEIILPGNPALLRRVLDGAKALSRPDQLIRDALPGEFTARAVLAGRITGEQAEGVQALIAAGNLHEHHLARALLDGTTGERYRSLADELSTLLALVEAGIDFTDQEDVVPIGASPLRERLESIRAEIASLLGPAAGAVVDESPVRIALVGRPNAGKSTLFNALLGRRRSLVSEHAGTTRDVIVEALPEDPLFLHTTSIELMDLAGLDEAMQQHGPAAGAAQVAARRAIEHADAVLWCDPTGRFEASGDLLSEVLRGKLTLRVRTMGDLAMTGEHDEQIAVCALDGWNLGPLRRGLADLAMTVRGVRSPDAPGALVARHRRSLSEAATAVEDALRLIAPADEDPRLGSPELIADALRHSLDRVGEIAGRIDPDDIIGRIFATFCIGK